MTKKKILIIDDDPDQVEILSRFLESNGFSVVSASRGQQGLDKLFSDDPDLVILDIMMPGMDGFKVCERIKSSKLKKYMPVIILTSKDLSKDFQTALDKKADWYVLKPFSSESLLSKIKLSLERAHTLGLGDRFTGDENIFS